MTNSKRLKPTTTLILIMLVVVAIALITARSHYKKINDSADPRVIPARMAYQEYNNRAAAGDFVGVLNVLDSIASIYNQYEHYQNSYEAAVVHINRSSVYLTVGLHIDSLRTIADLGWMQTKTKKGLLDLSEEEIKAAIEMYLTWDSLWVDLSEAAIKEKLNENFYKGLESYPKEDQENYAESRTKEITEAQWENDRRLSVAYSNLGMIWFQRDDYEQAAELYTKAVKLWEDNLTAKNNLNKMLGRPLEKRSMIQKLFPKERK